MPVTLGQLINGIGNLQVEISQIKALTQVVTYNNATAAQKSAKTEIRNQLKGIYNLLNTVSKKEGFIPNIDT